jgi:hypothetical protein
MDGDAMTGDRYRCHDGEETTAVALHGFGLTLSGQRRWLSNAA